MAPDYLTGVYLLDFFCSGIQFYVLLSPYLCFISFFLSGFICSRRWCIDMLKVFRANQFLCALVHIWTKGEVVVPLNRFKPSSKIFTDRSKAILLLWIFYVFSVLCLLCLCARLLICALWSPAEKGLTSWLSCVMSNCEFVTFPLVSLVRCGTWLYRFLIFAPYLTITYS